jgi:uncharacterized protein (DUF305 family)
VNMTPWRILSSSLMAVVGTFVIRFGHSATAGVVPSQEAAFLDESNVAMDRMMREMMNKPSGNVDRDFVDMMVPHHQGAIDMAIAVLRYGHNERIRRLAQEIVVDQQQEIAAMRLAVGQPLPASSAAPTTPPGMQ